MCRAIASAASKFGAERGPPASSISTFGKIPISQSTGSSSGSAGSSIRSSPCTAFHKGENIDGGASIQATSTTRSPAFSSSFVRNGAISFTP